MDKRKEEKSKLVVKMNALSDSIVNICKSAVASSINGKTQKGHVQFATEDFEKGLKNLVSALFKK